MFVRWRSFFLLLIPVVLLVSCASQRTYSRPLADLRYSFQKTAPSFRPGAVEGPADFIYADRIVYQYRYNKNIQMKAILRFRRTTASSAQSLARVRFKGMRRHERKKAEQEFLLQLNKNLP